MPALPMLIQSTYGILLLPILIAGVSGMSNLRGAVSQPLRSLGRPWHWNALGSRRVDGLKAMQYGDDCLREEWFEQKLDHFSARTSNTFEHRYFVCDKWWQSGGPIFFYAGNEDNVELYINATGLMWENAESFGALIVFAEHRYYGKTQPFGDASWRVDPSYLTTEQALMDFASLAFHITRETPGAIDTPIIVFGGSYGGMLASWLRLKYPHIFAGAIAGSAPIAQFPGERHRAFNPADYWEVVTQDASPAAGAHEYCASNVRQGFQVLFSLGASAEGRGIVQYLLRLCDPLDSEGDVNQAALWLQGAWDAYAMGNYPFESSYISGDPEHPLPAWPMVEACKRIPKGEHPPGPALLEGLRDAASLLYNITGELQCFDLQVVGPAAGNSGPWDYQWCTQMDGQELPYYPANGVTDMFWDQGMFWPDSGSIRQHCEEQWGVAPSMHHSYIQYGGAEAARSMSNIVFSNGLMDPWSKFGVVADVPSSVTVLLVPDGAHHVDLMFSNPRDTESIKAARRMELEHIRLWIAQYEMVKEGSS